MAQRYRHRPLIVEAVQWTGHNEAEVHAMVPAGAEVPFTGGDGIGALGMYDHDGRLLVANPGDWVIKAVNGYFYPCPPEVFAASYDLAKPDDPTL